MRSGRRRAKPGARFLPDGKGVLYSSTGGKYPGVYAASPDGSSRKLLKAGDVGALYLEHPRTRKSYLLLVGGTTSTAFLQQFELSALKLVGDPVPVAQITPNYFLTDSVPSVLLYLKRPLPRTRLAWFSRAGKEMETVAEADSCHDLSPDNRRVVWELLTEPNGFGDLWVKDLERGPRLRLTSDPGWEYAPHFWPDGSKIAFTWYRSQPYRFHLAIKPPNGSGSEELVLETHTRIFLDDVSPDGAFLIYSQDGPPSTLWVLPLTGERRPVLYRSGQGDNHDGKFSPDGHWIVYASTDSGRSEIHVQDFQPSAAGPPTGDLTVVSTEGGSIPRWSPDGKELFYLAPDNSLSAVPVKTGSQFSAGHPEKLFRVAPQQLYRIPYVPSADGRRFLIAVPEAGAPEGSVLVVMTNRMEALVQ